MKKLTFKVSTPKKGSLIALIKDVNKIPCRIQLDIENGFVTVENINNSSIDPVIELIDNYYTLLGVDIDNSDENNVNTSAVEKTTSVSTQTENVTPIKDFGAPSENDMFLKSVEVSTEKALLKTFSSAFDKLDPSKTIEEQINSFLTDIGMITTEKIVKQSFVIACAIEKITYEKVIHELHNIHQNLSEPNIKAVLKKNFKEWLTQYPELEKHYPKLSFMSLLKAFSKKFA